MIFAILPLLALSERSFKIVGNEFQMDGKPFRYFAGAFHYFRQHPDRWEDTMKKIANCGLNAVETYVAWNLHEPQRGHYTFEGICDIERWLKLAQKYNLYVIFRPGPFICAEWDFGGFPYWLMQELQELEFRRSNEKYLKIIDEWLEVLLPKIVPYLYVNGGNIFMVQIENEYGWYNACDKTYLRHLAELFHKILGDEVFLVTNDGGFEGNLKCGALPEVAYPVLDFGTGPDIKSKFELQRRFVGGTGPYANVEFYPGWLDHWGERHHTVSEAVVARDLDLILSLNASFNFYMFFGGTNFGFYNGANGDHHSYQADPTSYDYDAPLTEAGDLTSKYWKILDVIKKYRTDIPVYDVKNSTKKSYGTVTFTEGVSLYDSLEVITDHYKKQDAPMSFEELDQDFGYILYRTSTNGGKLSMPAVHDRAYVYVDKVRKGIVEHSHEKDMDIPAGKLDILVEHQGRNNYGAQFVETKGLTKGVQIDGKAHTGWEHHGFNMSKVKNLKWTKTLPTGTPAFYRGTFNVDELADTFLNPKGFVKGVAFINGFHIGRYWTIGPQLTLYVPSHLLKQGQNELIIFEQESLQTTVPTMSFDDTPQLAII